jgi:hypothetical protein
MIQFLFLPILQSSPYVKDVSGAFLPSRGTIILIILLVAGVIGIPATIYILKSKKSKRDDEDNKEFSYLKKLEELNLSEHEIEILNTLALYLPPGQNRQRLLTNRLFFDNCEKQLRDLEPIPDGELSALKVKLGFTAVAQGKEISSTVELEPEQMLHIDHEGIRSFMAFVDEIDTSELVLSVDDGVIPPGIGTDLYVTFDRREGRYSFNTSVTRVEGSVFGVDHSEQVKKRQKRKFFRKKVDKGVYVRLSGSTRSYVKSKLLEIGGGCTISNPEDKFPAGHFKQGNDIEIALRGDPPLRVYGEIIRTSEESRVLHLEFKIISEQVRDRLIGFVQTN